MSSETKRGFLTAIEHSHGRQLRRYLTTRVRGAVADVPDLFQEIFLRLLRINNHEAIRNPQAYLYTVASHVLHQYALQRSAAPQTMDPLELVSELQATDTAVDPADEVQVEQLIEALSGELQRVAPRAYAALIMYRCEGLTLQQIAERLGVTAPMARKYLLRAIAFCDRYLEDKENGR